MDIAKLCSTAGLDYYVHNIKLFNMDKIILDLFKDEEDWRLISFIDKMEDFKRECSTNQQEKFIRDGLYAAKALLQKREAERLETA